METKQAQSQKELSFVKYRLELSRGLRRSEVPLLRGFFGNKFDQAIVHHHNPDGTLAYDYPRIQFKVLDQQAILIGLEEGCDLLARLWLETDRAIIGVENLTVRQAAIQKRQVLIGEAGEPITYRFLTPWLALNQANDKRYRDAATVQPREELLGRILVGNCISLAKSFKYDVKSWLEADCSRLRSVTTFLKGTPMHGFIGEFQVNFLLPELIGIGKSVSRGFGTVIRCYSLRPDRRGGVR
ncbi:MAG: hypothetical protein M1548_09260 [Actinobacteria bacterium]|nr:hypothetical protein [Actinomycetota bacterium]